MISMLTADSLLAEIWTIYFSANLDLGLLGLETGDVNCSNQTFTLISVAMQFRSVVLTTFLLCRPAG